MSHLPLSLMIRCRGVLLLALCLALSLPTLAGAQSVPPVELSEVVNGLTMPIGMTHAGDGSGRIFIVEQGGTVRIWDGTQLLVQPFLDIPVACCGERGLLGIAFHPNYASNGFFYAHYSNPATPINRVDDFQNGDFYGWRVGSGATPFPPRLEPDVGPLGIGDDMLRLEADGGLGAGSRLVVFNQSQWTGDFVAQGITEITMDLQNVGVDPLTIRIGMRGAGGDIASLQGFVLPDNSGWVSVRFPIAVNEFVGLGADIAATLSSVTQLRILHNTQPEFIGEPIRGSLGIDNISADGTLNGGLGASVVSRFSVSSSPNVAESSSEVVLFTQEQPFGNHNGGQIGFGPDGYLYFALGDGGAGGDPLDHGQNPNTLLGTILRLDAPADAGDPNPKFTVPPDNPFVGVAGFRNEIWAYGLRNPWRFSFDRATGDLFIADVGQNAVEEINHQLSSSPGGENYGWRLMEGSQCFNPSSSCNDGTLVLPVIEYSHAEGCSITGGYRYRGSRYPSLDGVFFFGDFCSGTIWGGQEDSAGMWTHAPVLSSGLNISSFGEDESGEVYVLDYGGSLYRVDLVVAPTKITAPAAGTTLVAASTVIATGSGANLSWTVMRQPDGLAVATGAGSTLSFVVPADSTALQSIVIELDGDGGKDTIAYAIQPLAPLAALATAVPATGTAPLNVQFTGAGVGGTGVYTFEWNFGDGSAVSIEQNPAHVYQAVGIFTAVLTVTDSAAATATANVAIDAQATPPKIVTPPANTVLDAGATVAATGTGLNLRWTITREPGAFPVATGTGLAITFVVPPDSTALQKILIVLDGDGGPERLEYPIRPAAAPLVAMAEATPTTGTIPLTVQFMGSASGGAGSYTFEWNFGDGSALTTEQNPSHIYQSAGSFTPVLTVRDVASGTATATVVISARSATGAGFECDQIDVFWVASRRDYHCAVLSIGDHPYTDSDVVLAAIPPELENTAWIQTANRDARRRRRWHIIFRVTAPVKVMVGFDAEARRLPRWLRHYWKDEGKTVTLDNGRVLNLYSRDYEPGWVVLLGGNRARGARWPRRVRPIHYVVGLAPATP